MKDADGLQDVQAITVTVNDVNEVPGAASFSSGGSVNENSANATVVGTVHAIDPDAGDTVTYSLSDNAGGRFAIDAATGVVTVANGSLLDFEAKASHDIMVVADDGTLTSSTKLTVAVNDVDPEILTGTAGKDTLTAELGNYHISGLADDDTLTGNTGNDLLIGGDDNDKLTGGGGTNTFEFSLTASAGADTITDFNKASDVLSFRDVIDDDGTAGLDIGDLHITKVTDGGIGNDVTVEFQSGGSMVFQGAGTGAVDSIDDLVNNAGTQIQISSS